MLLLASRIIQKTGEWIFMKYFHLIIFWKWTVPKSRSRNFSSQMPIPTSSSCFIDLVTWILCHKSTAVWTRWMLSSDITITLLMNNMTGRHRGLKQKLWPSYRASSLQHTSYVSSSSVMHIIFFIVKCGITHFLCAMHVFKVQASSSSPRLPLCQISFLSRPPLLS